MLPEVYATARTWWLHGGRPGCPFSCRVHGPARCGSASLWNINMTRNIISHDSRRRGNTKYYPAEAPVGWPAGLPTPAAWWLYFAPGSSPQDMQRSRNAVINWLSRVTTPRCGRKKRACERASERAKHLTNPIPQLPLQFSIKRS